MVTTNPLLAEARGALGKVVVFKQMYGKTVMTNYPRKADIPREKQSEAQRHTRDNFRNAAAFAKHALNDPAQRAYYEKKKVQLGLYSAYHAAITEYMRCNAVPASAKYARALCGEAGCVGGAGEAGVELDVVDQAGAEATGSYGLAPGGMEDYAQVLIQRVEFSQSTVPPRDRSRSSPSLISTDGMTTSCLSGSIMSSASSRAAGAEPLYYRRVVCGTAAGLRRLRGPVYRCEPTACRASACSTVALPTRRRSAYRC